MSGQLSDYITERALAEALGRTVHALRKWRQTGYGPAWAKIGRQVLYRRSDVAGFLDEQVESRRHLQRH